MPTATSRRRAAAPLRPADRRRDDPPAIDEMLSMTIADASARTSISKPQLYRLIAAGQIETFRLGRRRYVDAGSLRAFLDAAKAAAPAAPRRRRRADGTWAEAVR